MTTASLVMPINEACTALSVGRSTIYNLMAAGKLKIVKIGRSTRITTESIRALVEGGAAE